VLVALISGDKTAVGQVKKLLGDVEGVVVKEGIGTIAKTIRRKPSSLLRRGLLEPSRG